ncbi:MAG: PocR ligand-binding domain-containing protein [Pseudodesulfovibrio sp.]|nr:PocR ligand-binding domain-containing protein [Pseudomonadota bacterium]MBV1765100.1 PocR ligand-binding domain-containing protein [Pseudodesulfovibrio sp.]MBU4244253.1 PocR ligand-binding domain-containing protein [Pseudomonadota bacterium]MBU4379899.1 PocR ligand-binding domain-containing protein [Pseudomonadota bacterium]MBU4474884.1 PocR ligand-binding domain-containing protein [Pseudomonadota bacterium]
MHLTDLQPKEKWVELQQELHDRFHLNADVMDRDGTRLTGNTWGNDLCRAIREDAKGHGAICAPAGQVFVHLMQEGRAAFVEECDAGMVRISVPVIKDGELLGSVGGCGLMPEEGEVDEFMVEMSTDMDAETVAGLAKTVPVASEQRVREILEFIEARVAELIT